ncbi:hypothetical protein [Pseudovibrio brasiliensis]|uniref:Uncharacterized protein n=1 Tax=Pseudovibrio brasiliensis TaxID=1898042 RepID=A0ABX8ATZ2_9HYPH|nr:hypothetical protein [Pseudovibrio brasiliensis]QUS57340.1 hypothetical protein KGB56_08105 [Pseudovibrio brasiliensis]
MNAPQSHPVLQHFANELRGTFSRTTGSSDKAYFADLCKNLEGFDPEILSEAAWRLMRRAKTQTWPLPGVCLDACEAVARERSVVKKRERHSSEGRWGLPEEAALRILVRSDASLALKAVEGEWHGGLVDFIKRHHRMPTEAEIERVVVDCEARKRNQAREEEAELRAVFGKNWGGKELPARNPRKIMWNAFKARRDRYAEKISEAVLTVGPMEGESNV